MATLRLRAIQLRHWKRPRTIYREIMVLGGTGGCGQTGGRPLPPVVVQQRRGHEVRADHCLLRSAGSAKVVMTSSSRVARCGPACRGGAGVSPTMGGMPIGKRRLVFFTVSSLKRSVEIDAMRRCKYSRDSPCRCGIAPGLVPTAPLFFSRELTEQDAIDLAF